MLKVCLRRAGLTALSAGFEQPLLSKTEENETRGLCRAASESHLWSFLTVRFSFSFTFSLTINLFSFSDQNQFCRIHSSCCYFHGAAAVLSAQLIAPHFPHAVAPFSSPPSGPHHQAARGRPSLLGVGRNSAKREGVCRAALSLDSRPC